MKRLILALLVFFAPLKVSAQEVIILLGPPGSGKGTQAEVIKTKLNVAHISTGDLLRAYVKNAAPDNKLAAEIKEYMNSGQLIPDSVITELLKERISQPDAKAGFMLDGYPRTTAQAESLSSILPKEAKLNVLYFNVPDETLIKRVAGRNVCSSCGAIYNDEFSPPKVAGTCDTCQGKVVKRADDNEETIKKRLEVYHKETAPLIDYYEKKGVLRRFDSSLDSKDVSKKVLDALSSH